MRKLKPWFLILLVFTAGVVCGVVGARQVVRQSFRAAIQNPDSVREQIEHRLISKLALIPEQQTQVHGILLNAHQQIQQLRSELQPRYMGIVDQAESGIAQHLTPQQLEQFKQLMQEREFLWRPPQPPPPK